MASKILLQTTIPFTEDDWHIGRFSLLREHLSSLEDETGAKLYEVTARNREENEAGNDVVLSRLSETDFDQLWLFAVDTGSGLTWHDCEGVTRFRQRGGGVMSTRDHHDLGVSLCSLGGVGAAHHFHSKNQDPDESRRVRDDEDDPDIDYPNYHSGSNGDFQRVGLVEPVHELLKRADNSPIEFFPSHPHEGSVSAPAGNESARAIATGKSQTTGREFNLIIAFEHSTDTHGNTLGRGIAESSFHHLVDYNWNPDMGCPTFLTDPPGNGYRETPEAIEDVKNYAANLARWLSS